MKTDIRPVLALMVFGSPLADACSCAELPKTPEQAGHFVENSLDDSGAVFVGRIETIVETEEPTNPYHAPDRLITVRVVNAIMGTQDGQTVELGWHFSMCSAAPFVLGDTYLLFTRALPKNGPVDYNTCGVVKYIVAKDNKPPNAEQGIAEARKSEIDAVIQLLRGAIEREDRTADGSVRIDPTLGPDAKGILTYANGRFAAQFMKRDRSDASETSDPSPGRNNTGAVGGYDAYFGTYSVDEESGDVLHCLEGALTPENVGMEVSRTLTVNDDSLVIQLETTTIEGEPVVRTLTWERVA